MIGDVWYDDVEVAQLPETNNASRRKMSAEEKCPAAEMAAVSLPTQVPKYSRWSTMHAPAMIDKRPFTPFNAHVTFSAYL